MKEKFKPINPPKIDMKKPIKERLEKKTNSALKAINSIGKLNSAHGEYSEADVEKITEALYTEIQKMSERLKKAPTPVDIQFSLKD